MQTVLCTKVESVSLLASTAASSSPRLVPFQASRAPREKATVLPKGTAPHRLLPWLFLPRT